MYTVPVNPELSMNRERFAQKRPRSSFLLRLARKTSVRNALHCCRELLANLSQLSPETSLSRELSDYDQEAQTPVRRFEHAGREPGPPVLSIAQ